MDLRTRWCERAADRSHRDTGDVVVVVAPFRSGSTAVWNLLRSHPSITAYYEPFHEHLLDHVTDPPPADPSHVGLDGPPYFHEYQAVPTAALGYTYRRAVGFAFDTWATPDAGGAVAAYLRTLVDAAPTRVCALQLNRACLALPTIRDVFPGAYVVTLHRPAVEAHASGARHRTGSFAWYAARYASHLPGGESLVTRSCARVPAMARLAQVTRPRLVASWFASYHDRFDSDALYHSDMRIRHGDLGDRAEALVERLAEATGVSASAFDLGCIR